MKKTLAHKKGRTDKNEVASKYGLDYSKSKPNRFAARMSGGAIAVALEPDVAAVPQSRRKRAH